MPELPEVETITRGLRKAIVGKTIIDIEVNKPKQFVGEKDDVLGKKILAVNRFAKMIKIDLEGENMLLVHLKMTGQLVWSEKKVKSSKFKVQSGEGEQKIDFGHKIPFAGGNELPGKATHIIFHLDKGTLFYNDVRQFGWIKIVQRAKCKVQSEFAKLGPEPLDFIGEKSMPNKEFSVEYLKKIFAKTAKPIKLVIMDQEKIAGVGNIYANDALFEAKILPDKSAKSLSDEEIEQLREGIIKVLEEGIKYGGSSAGDEAYVNTEAEGGNYQNHSRVYQRDGEKCKRCGGTIVRSKIGGRGTFFCDGCQK
jgi:formamidopyrimidine-DNA glycosylase